MNESFWHKRHVLVTGPCSTVGRSLIPELSLRGALVHGVGSTEQDKLHEPPALSSYTMADLRTGSFSIQSPISIVFHLAASPGDRAFVYSNPNSVMSNVLMDLNVVDWALRANVERFVFASSATAGVWFESHEGDCGPVPDGLFGQAKRLTETYLDALRESHDLSTVSARLFTIFGSPVPGKDLISSWLASAMENKSITVFGGRQERNFVHIIDVCAALRILGECTVNGQIDIGSQERMSLTQAAKLFKTRYPGSLDIVYQEYPFGSWAHQKADNCDIVSLGWTPQWSLSEYFSGPGSMRLSPGFDLER